MRAATRSRGHTLLLVMLVMVAVGVGVSVFVVRASVASEARRSNAIRTQALWLARSACLAKLSGKQTVVTSVGAAEVSRAGARVEVQLSGGHAQLDCADGALGYESRR